MEGRASGRWNEQSIKATGGEGGSGEGRSQGVRKGNEGASLAAVLNTHDTGWDDLAGCPGGPGLCAVSG